MNRTYDDHCSGFEGLTEEQLSIIDTFSQQDQIILSMRITDGFGPKKIAHKLKLDRKYVANHAMIMRKAIGHSI